ncbi:membrane protein insertion efficiency factor YidD [Patescibacteria group bacterium]|nr:membrane protein insertion efficiency factor YidD [Patescibacteria group bacterium]MBU1074961.1 membrane protein insertion efficiency factor YidD [Patescibacteria group bacterium]MBU1951444.1 membrane protein insertion efficiency factor YidD [Patescibacteria group bacterium]MBU2229198.1 membrane protein insertion efficiency factor YidD [Patescibacteria group bacterium]
MPNDKSRKIFLGIRKGLLVLIRIYQKVLSPDHGLFSYKHPYGYCKHSPSCSEYAYQAVDTYGVIKGSAKAIKRVIRCNPFSQGGYDPIDVAK